MLSNNFNKSIRVSSRPVPNAKTTRRSAKMVIKSGSNVPLLGCDQCGEPIHSRNGIAVWKRSDGTVYHLHKGACDRKFQSKFTERLLWSSLDKHLDDLSHNTLNVAGGRS